MPSIHAAGAQPAPEEDDSFQRAGHEPPIPPHAVETGPTEWDEWKSPRDLD